MEHTPSSNLRITKDTNIRFALAYQRNYCRIEMAEESLNLGFITLDLPANRLELSKKDILVLVEALNEAATMIEKYDQN